MYDSRSQIAHLRYRLHSRQSRLTFAGLRPPRPLWVADTPSYAIPWKYKEGTSKSSRSVKPRRTWCFNIGIPRSFSSLFLLFVGGSQPQVQPSSGTFLLPGSSVRTSFTTIRESISSWPVEDNLKQIGWASELVHAWWCEHFLKSCRIIPRIKMTLKRWRLYYFRTLTLALNKFAKFVENSDEMVLQ